MIEPIDSNDIVQSLRALGGEVEYAGASVQVSGVCVDSRRVAQDDLFVALPGAQVDGHDFVAAALAKGAALAMVERLVAGVPAAQQIRVPSTLAGIATVAGINRRNFGTRVGGKVIGITGSSGKTSTKRMLHTVLSQVAPTLATQGNQNNELGVPLTLLNIGPEHRYAIVEMGARQVGDIAYLGKFVQQDVAILLNAGQAHVGVFGSVDNIVRAKGEIYGALPVDGVAIINLDQPASAIWQETAKGHRVVTYAMTADAADIRARHVRYAPGFSSYELCAPEGKVAVTLPLAGAHNVENSLAVAAAACALGLTLNQIAEGLALCDAEPGRLQRKVMSQGTVLLDDSYNANPASMRAALNVLALQDGAKIAVLGEMGELGEHAEEAHLALADVLAAHDLAGIYLVGTYAGAMAERLPGKARVYPDNQALAQDLRAHLNGNECVLIKGSRFTTMDQVVACLLNENMSEKMNKKMNEKMEQHH